ncbi:MAG: cardiolipin synthase [Gemmataceae bacterium]
MSGWETLEYYWREITAIGAFLDIILVVVTIGWVLTLKKEPTSALAWCLLVLLLPLLGPLLFVFFGYQNVHRPLSRKRRHKQHFQRSHAVTSKQLSNEAPPPVEVNSSWHVIAELANHYEAFPVHSGNAVTFYHEGESAFAAKLEAIRSAQHHIHLEYFIFQPDDSGQLFMDALVQKAKEGIEVRLVYDAIGSHRLHRRLLRVLQAAGGKCSAFLPLSPLRRRFQVNLRNHRKILVVDGRVAFTGGLNIGEEYVSKNPRYGFWRDTHLKLEGPAVSSLQWLFIEDWDFASGETLNSAAYFPTLDNVGSCPVQVIHSGPDQMVKSIREIYFAAILRARRRVWIASPYFVPDTGLLDALRLAGSLGVDVRFLGLYRPDKWIPLFAARYYWEEVMRAGVKVYQYTKGMMHSKLILVDDDWASVGTANFDNRSMFLNFEVNCLIYSSEAVAELEQAFLRDLDDAILIEPSVYRQRPFSGRLIENFCRLLSPVL